MELYSLFQRHPLVCTDSRNCPSGAIFFALKGENYDANTFAEKALENGCSYAVIDNPKFALDNRYVVVDDVLKSLQNLATEHRLTIGTPIIGITGTNGKTTSKELIASVLKEKYNILYTQGNLNNHIGVPLTLLQLKAEHELAVIEMGANHPGEIAALCAIAQPNYGIITNVGKAHLEGFGSFEGVKNTKGELYCFIAQSGEKVFLNASNEHLIQMAKKNNLKDAAKIVKYGIGKFEHGSKIKGSITDCSPFLKIKCNIAENEFTLDTQLIGSYNTENIMAAVTIGDYFGLSQTQIKHGIESYIPTNNRSQLTLTENNRLIVDAYNANPTSMRAAILNFAQMQVDNKILILGDMFELGTQSATEHQKIIDLLNEKQLNKTILVGKDFSRTQNDYLCFETVDDLIKYLSQKPIYDSMILVKGSRGMKLEKAIQSL